MFLPPSNVRLVMREMWNVKFTGWCVRCSVCEKCTNVHTNSNLFSKSNDRIFRKIIINTRWFMLPIELWFTCLWMVMKWWKEIKHHTWFKENKWLEFMFHLLLQLQSKECLLLYTVVLKRSILQLTNIRVKWNSANYYWLFTWIDQAWFDITQQTWLYL